MVVTAPWFLVENQGNGSPCSSPCNPFPQILLRNRKPSWHLKNISILLQANPNPKEYLKKSWCRALALVSSMCEEGLQLNHKASVSTQLKTPLRVVHITDIHCIF